MKTKNGNKINRKCVFLSTYNDNFFCGNKEMVTPNTD